MSVRPYLSFDGDCAEALEFYLDVIGGEILVSMTFADAPEPMNLPDEWRSKIMHATFQLNGQVLMGSDGFPGSYNAPRGIHLALAENDPGRAEELFARLSEGGKVEMAMGETFWAQRFGMCTDRFGIPWMVDCPKPGFAG